jgi:NADH dehydrogenase
MKVFVTGASGFVGSEILRQLGAAGHTPRCLVRPGAEGKLALRQGVEIHHGDATVAASLEGALTGCDAVIHLIGIIREFPGRGITFRQMHVAATENILAAAENQGVRRFLHMSANGARAGAPSPYHSSKWTAEERVREADLDWTIFRPSLIFGPGDGFVTMLADMIRRFPAVPVIGDGQYTFSPVAVSDVAAGFVAALTTPAAIGQSYACGGPETLTYDAILDHIGSALGKKHVTKIHYPLFMMKPLVAMLEKIPAFPITTSQLTMLLEGNSCDPAPFAAAFSLTPTPFTSGVRRYLKT